MSLGPPLHLSARWRNLSVFQWMVLGALCVGVAVLAWLWPQALGQAIRLALAAGFVVAVCIRVAALFATPQPRRFASPPDLIDPPPYAVIVALHDEADLIPQLLDRLDAIRYPRDRLRGFIVIEPFDFGTRNAIRDADLPGWIEIVTAPAGAPVTKPRALNAALSRIHGGLVCVFDAEDAPHPDQLLEAAARFESAGPDLACLQAPLRIRTPGGGRWMDRQFAAEYGALFEVLLPALAESNLPLPLGGTSNHFRTDALDAVGGWDPWNVTEDADLGFRLARARYRTGMISRPTTESPPGLPRHWLPQRTRWLKGFMQTWGVHTRDIRSLGLRAILSLTLTIGLTLASALVQGVVVIWVLAVLLASAVQNAPPQLPTLDLSLAAAGWPAGAAVCWLGARRAGTRYGVLEAVTAPAYWMLSTLALTHAAWRLATEPFYWDKTQHQPDPAHEAEPVRGLRRRARIAT